MGTWTRACAGLFAARRKHREKSGVLVCFAFVHHFLAGEWGGRGGNSSRRALVTSWGTCFQYFFIIGCRAYWLGEVLLTQMETQRDIHQRAADDLIEAGLDLQVA